MWPSDSHRIEANGLLNGIAFRPFPYSFQEHPKQHLTDPANHDVPIDGELPAGRGTQRLRSMLRQQRVTSFRTTSGNSEAFRMLLVFRVMEAFECFDLIEIDDLLVQYVVERPTEPITTS